MPATATPKYPTFLAQQFLTQLTGNAVAAYVFVGQVSPWVDAANVAVSDSNPPVPVNDVQQVDFDYWRGLIGAKRVGAANTQFVVSRVNWTSGIVYAQYDDADALLFTKAFYVLDTTASPYKVYKCVWNNGGRPSTVAPNVIGTALVPTATSDGYVWQYLYTIGSDNYTFLTNTWMPVLANTAVQNNASATAGTLPISVPFVVSAGGNGYDPVVNTVITVSGDGSGATVTANGVTIVGGTVTKVSLATGGNNYTAVSSINVFQSGAGTSAICRAIIPPFPNHGFDPLKELHASAIMLTVQFEEGEGGLLTTNNDFRQVGLVVNPKDAGGNVASLLFYRQTTDITLASNTGIFHPDDVIVNTTKNTAPFATVVDVIQPIANGSFVVRTTRLNPQGESDPFSVSDTFHCVASGVQGVVLSVSPPQLQPYSGSVLYVNQRTPVTRGNTQIEEIKIVFPLG